MKKNKKIFSRAFLSFLKDERGEKKSGCLVAVVAVILLTTGIYTLAMIFPAMGLFIKNRGSGNAEATEPAWSGSDDTIPELDGLKMPATEGKLGSEEHMSSKFDKTKCFIPGNSHYEGPDSNPLTYTLDGPDGSCGSYPPRTTDQERWYFNMRWPSGKFAHKKVIVTNPKNGKRVVVSIEEYGPAEWVTRRNGINCGAPPEVRNYLETGSAYTPPSDKTGFVIFGFAKDQNIPLGPLQPLQVAKE